MKLLTKKSHLLMRFFAFSSIVLFLCVGCKEKITIPDDDDNIEEVILTIDITDVQMKPEGEEVRIPIITNTDLDKPICTHDWLNAEIINDNSVLVIKAGANTTDAERVSNVTVKTRSGAGKQLSRSVKVTQSNMVVDETFEFSQDLYNLNPTEGTLSVSLFSNGKWEINQEVIPGWLDISPTSGENDASITVKYKSNVSINERTAHILFKNLDNGNSAVLNLKQESNPSGLKSFSHLGKGYDAMGEYAYDEYVKAPVLDCQKLYEANHIADPITPNNTVEDVIVGNTREEYISKYNVSAGISAEAFGFSTSLQTNFSESALSVQENSFGTFRHITKKQIIKLHENLTPDMLTSCISQTFTEDVKKLSVNDLVSKYGTHVIMGLSIGGVLDYSMSADASVSGRTVDMGLALQAGFKMASCGVSGSVGYDEYESLKNEDACMEMKLICRGGESQFASTGMGNSESTYNNWLASLQDINKWVMVDYEGNQLIPIYKFMKDNPSKAEETRTFIDDLLSVDRLPKQESKWRLLNIELTKVSGKSADGIFIPEIDATVDVILDGTIHGTIKFTSQPSLDNPPYFSYSVSSDLDRPFKVNSKRVHELKIRTKGTANSPAKNSNFDETVIFVYNVDNESWHMEDSSIEYSDGSYFEVKKDPLITFGFKLHWTK